MDVIVNGGGISGLMAALAFQQDGHRVTVVERDANPVPPTPSEAFTSWDRQGAPHVRHSHAFLARLRQLLQERQPEVLRGLFDAGCTELTLAEMWPPAITDRSPLPGDEELVLLLCRRITFEWVLRRIVSQQSAITWRTAAVSGLRSSRAEAGIPVVDGVVLDNGQVVSGDLVVEAGGRRSAIMRYLAELGTVAPSESIHECGIVYYTRFYAFHDGAIAPEGPANGDVGYVKFGAFRGDNRTYSITLATWGEDRDMRRVARPEIFDEVCQRLPSLAPWVAPTLGEPITGVEVMAKLRNRRRHFVVDDQPVVLGLAVIGDAAICTNPLYGRGCTTGSVHAHLAADAYKAHRSETTVDLDGFARQLHQDTVSEIEPFYRSAVAQDGDSRATAVALAAASGETDGAVAAPAEDPMRAIVLDGLMPALRTDPVVFRAFMRAFNLLDVPEAMMGKADVIARVIATYEARADRPAPASLGPPRRDMIKYVDELLAG